MDIPNTMGSRCTNEPVLKQPGTKTKLSTVVNQRYLKYFKQPKDHGEVDN